MKAGGPQSRVCKSVHQKRERGATAIEYALMVGLLAIGLIASTVVLKDKVGTTLRSAAPQNVKWRFTDHLNQPGTIEMVFVGQQARGQIRFDGWPYDDPLVGTSSVSTANVTTFSVTRNCSRFYAGCLQVWTGTVLADGTGSGSYSGTNTGSFLITAYQ